MGERVFCYSKPKSQLADKGYKYNWEIFKGTLEEFEYLHPGCKVVFVFTKEDNLLR